MQSLLLLLTASNLLKKLGTVSIISDFEQGNERADRLASTTDITSGLQLGRAEVLRGLRNFLNIDRPEHHSTDRLKERGVEKRNGRHSNLRGRERSVLYQTNIGTVSRATLGRLLRDGAERVWAFPSATMPSGAETETEQGFVVGCLLNVPATCECISGTDLLKQLRAVTLR